MSRRAPRHVLVALLTALVASVGGMGAVAFGQTSNDQTSGYTVETVPLGDYTATTPSLPPTPRPTVTAQAPTQTSGTTPPPQSRPTPARPTTPTAVPPSPAGGPPSRTTREAPRHLAFTGAEPLIVGAGGLVLMLGGFVLHRRRRPAPPAA